MSHFTDLFKSDIPESVNSTKTEIVSDANEDKSETKEKKIVTSWKSRKNLPDGNKT